MNFGIFGGTFNPPHLGHLIVAESVRDQLKLAKVLFIPSANPPNKHGDALVPVGDRLVMTRLAVEGNPAFEVSDLEAVRGGTSYTVDTVSALSAKFPNASLQLIIGADNLEEFETWKSPEEILTKVDLAAMTRPGFELQKIRSRFAKQAKFVKVPQIAISGTEIRRRVKMGRSIRYLVPRAVEDYIVRTGLYR